MSNAYSSGIYNLLNRDLTYVVPDLPDLRIFDALDPSRRHHTAILSDGQD